MTDLSKKLMSKYVGKYTPEEVLQMAMDYLHEKSERHGKFIEEKLAAEDVSGTELRLHYETMRKTREQLIDVAHKLIPFKTPRLESISVQSEEVHKFVMLAPEVAKSPQAFLEALGKSTEPVTATQRVSDTLANPRKTPSTLDIDDDPENDPPLLN